VKTIEIPWLNTLQPHVFWYMYPYNYFVTIKIIILWYYKNNLIRKEYGVLTDFLILNGVWDI